MRKPRARWTIDLVSDRETRRTACRFETEGEARAYCENESHKAKLVDYLGTGWRAVPRYRTFTRSKSVLP